VTREAQKELERRWLQWFLEVGELGDRVENVEPADPPDFYFDFDGRRIGAEMTEFHVRRGESNASSPRSVESEWERITDRLLEDLPEDLRGWLGYLKLRSKELAPGRREQDQFIEEVYRATREVVASKRNHLEVIPGEENPLLREYVREIALARIEAHGGWDTDLHVGSVGLDHEDLRACFEGKQAMARPDAEEFLALGRLRLAKIAGPRPCLHRQVGGRRRSDGVGEVNAV
jgi:hypothetical protein